MTHLATWWGHLVRLLLLHHRKHNRTLKMSRAMSLPNHNELGWDIRSSFIGLDLLLVAI
jgi:hypothetical protein